MSDGAEIVVEDSSLDFIVKEFFELDFDEFGFLVDEDDNLVVDTKGRPIMRHQIGMFIPGEDRDVVPVRDHFVDIVDHVRGREKTYDDELELRERATDIREIDE